MGGKRERSVPWKQQAGKVKGSTTGTSKIVPENLEVKRQSRLVLC